MIVSNLEKENAFVDYIIDQLNDKEDLISNIYKLHLENYLLTGLKSLKELYKTPTLNDFRNLLNEIITLSKQNCPEIFYVLKTIDWNDLKDKIVSNDLISILTNIYICENLSLKMESDDNIYDIISKRWYNKSLDYNLYGGGLGGIPHIIKSLSLHHYGSDLRLKLLNKLNNNYGSILLPLNITEAVIFELFSRGISKNVKVGKSIIKFKKNISVTHHKNILKSQFNLDRDFLIKYWLWNISLVIRFNPGGIKIIANLLYPQLFRKISINNTQKWMTDRAMTLQMTIISKFTLQPLMGFYPCEKIANHFENYAYNYYKIFSLEPKIKYNWHKLFLKLFIFLFNNFITVLMAIEYYLLNKCCLFKFINKKKKLLLG